MVHDIFYGNKTLYKTYLSTCIRIWLIENPMVFSVVFKNLSSEIGFISVHYLLKVRYLNKPILFNFSNNLSFIMVLVIPLRRGAFLFLQFVMQELKFD